MKDEIVKIAPDKNYAVQNMDASTSLKVNSSRIVSIDFLRGLIMVIMALDHVRDYIHFDAFLYNPLYASKTYPLLYITRWITHFCAPTFVLLAGVSAYLLGTRISKKILSRFLLTRGLWLIFADLVIVSTGWSFNSPPHFMSFGVVSTIGMSMIILSLLIYLPYKLILAFGITIIALNNCLDNVHFTEGSFAQFTWSLIHERRIFQWGDGYTFSLSYPFLAWAGVMAAGYCLGAIFKPDYDSLKRKHVLRYTGLLAIVLFFVLRYFNIYGDASHWQSGANTTQTVMIFFNVQKYPPSLLFILATLGPVLLFSSFIIDSNISPSNPLVRIGRVPFFYYVLHIYLIHFIAMIVAVSTGHPWTDMVTNSFIFNAPQLKGTYGLSLLWVYVIWVFVIAIMYPLCKWYNNFKHQHKNWRWLSYL